MLDRLLSELHAGRSSALVIRGEAGSGKTALLAHLEAQAQGCRLASVTGVQSEIELAFAGLHQVCGPMLAYADRLPAPQRSALHAAFGLTAGAPAERFLVGLAALNVLTLAAEERPLLALVDDAHWVDRESMQALAFVARRLFAEPIALVFTARGPDAGAEPTGLPEMTLSGLTNQDARRLLASATHVRLDHQVEERLIGEAHGNPLALLELSRAPSSAGLAGGFQPLDAGTLQGPVERSYGRRLQVLSPRLRKLLVVAAAEPVGDLALLRRAAGVLGLTLDPAASLDLRDFVELGSPVRFRHPLVRSAVYRLASPADRIAAHRALADATDPELDPDRQAWHRAQATSGVDDAVADELARSAMRARGRGGMSAAAAFLLRAIELTSDSGRRAEWALEAAAARFAAGAPADAYELLAGAELGPLDQLQQARLARLRGNLALLRRGSDAPLLLVDSARRLAALDPPLSRETYLEAYGAALYVGRLDGGRSSRDVAIAARDAPPAPDPPRAMDLLLDALVAHSTVGAAAATRSLGEAVRAFARTSDSEIDLHSSWLAARVAAAIWDDGAWDELTDRVVRLARDSGALSVLPLANTYRAGVLVHAGEFAAAAALIEEAETISHAVGSPALTYTSLVLAAWRGHEAAVADMLRAALPDATDRGEGRVLALADYATAVLYNGLGRYQEALAAARHGCEYQDLGLFGWSLTELIEAATRAGQPERAELAFQELKERTRASNTDWALGIQARSAAVLSDGPEGEDNYREAVDRLSRSRIKVDLARSHLLYGEWLRRANRVMDARAELHRAHDMFDHMGAQAFAARSLRELRAAGDTATTHTAPNVHALTPQELQIAQLARTGHTNPEIGAQLFISPRTVEWHLAKVFAKLNIRSRSQLRGTLF